LSNRLRDAAEGDHAVVRGPFHAGKALLDWLACDSSILATVECVRCGRML